MLLTLLIAQTMLRKLLRLYQKCCWFVIVGLATVSDRPADWEGHEQSCHCLPRFNYFGNHHSRVECALPTFITQVGISANLPTLLSFLDRFWFASCLNLKFCPTDLVVLYLDMGIQNGTLSDRTTAGPWLNKTWYGYSWLAVYSLFCVRRYLAISTADDLPDWFSLWEIMSKQSINVCTIGSWTSGEMTIPHHVNVFSDSLLYLFPTWRWDTAMQPLQSY